MTEGYIKYPRKLNECRSWKALPYTYRHVFLTIMSHASHCEDTFDDNGVIIPLLPGQFVTTIRRLVELCNEPDIDKSLIERALARFEKVGFSRQEVRHIKTIITITEPEFCEALKKKIETTFETKSRQDRDTKEELRELKELKDNKEIKRRRSNIHLTPPPASSFSLEFQKYAEVYFDANSSSFKNADDGFLAALAIAFPEHTQNSIEGAKKHLTKIKRYISKNTEKMCDLDYILRWFSKSKPNEALNVTGFENVLSGIEENQPINSEIEELLKTHRN